MAAMKVTFTFDTVTRRTTRISTWSHRGLRSRPTTPTPSLVSLPLGASLDPIYKARGCKHSVIFNQPKGLVDVFFRCKRLEPKKAYTRNVWTRRIRSIAEDMRKRDPVLAAIIKIKSCCHPERAEKCIEVLEDYLRHILDSPEKNGNYIDVTTKSFLDVVVPIEGAVDFLYSVGFKKIIENGMERLVFYEYDSGKNDLSVALHLLRSVEGYQFELDRDCSIFTMPFVRPDIYLAREFYDVDLVHGKVLASARRKLKNFGPGARCVYGELTKNLRPLYTRLEIRVATKFVLEGTFAADECLSDVRRYIEEVFDLGVRTYVFYHPELLYTVRHPEEKTLDELGLVPVGRISLVAKGSVNLGSLESLI